MKKWLVIFVLAVLVAGGWYGYRYWKDNRLPDVTFRTATVSRGELLAAIGATGTVEPEEVVDVGAQVAGQIVEFGKDDQGKTIDYGSQITKGMILAKIDESLFQSDVEQQAAAVAQADAAVVRAEADLGQLKAKVAQAQSDWDRAQKLGPSDALSQVNYDQYKANYLVAQANVKVGEAAIVQVQAARRQSQAGLERAKRNLGYCVITAPVSGVIIDRRVNIGQTVVSSFNAPSLFLIAKDLTRVQVWVAVNEADIGSITAGQPVTFSVDALPDRVFKGQVNKVRLNATMTQNVVTYTVVVTADNSDGKLLPYLTANTHFETARHADVLMIPNVALRWAPGPERITAGNARVEDEKRDSSGAGNGTLWVKAEKGMLRLIRVKTGPTDGAMTEVSGASVQEKMEVVIGEKQGDAGNAGAAASPFTPQFPRRR